MLLSPVEGLAFLRCAQQVGGAVESRDVGQRVSGLAESCFVRPHRPPPPGNSGLDWATHRSGHSADECRLRRLCEDPGGAGWCCHVLWASPETRAARLGFVRIRRHHTLGRSLPRQCLGRCPTSDCCCRGPAAGSRAVRAVGILVAQQNRETLDSANNDCR